MEYWSIGAAAGGRGRLGFSGRIGRGILKGESVTLVSWRVGSRCKGRSDELFLKPPFGFAQGRLFSFAITIALVWQEVEGGYMRSGEVVKVGFC